MKALRLFYPLLSWGHQEAPTLSGCADPGRVREHGTGESGEASLVVSPRKFYVPACGTMGPAYMDHLLAWSPGEKGKEVDGVKGPAGLSGIMLLGLLEGYWRAAGWLKAQPSQQRKH